MTLHICEPFGDETIDFGRPHPYWSTCGECPNDRACAWQVSDDQWGVLLTLAHQGWQRQVFQTGPPQPKFLLSSAFDSFRAEWGTLPPGSVLTLLDVEDPEHGARKITACLDYGQGPMQINVDYALLFW